MIRAVIFDLDDTLYRELDYVEAAFREVASYLALKYSLSEEAVFADIMELLHIEGRGKIFDHICEKYKIPEPVPELVKIYRATKPELKLYPDAQELLQLLEKKQFRRGVITDGCAQVQHAKIDGLKLEQRMSPGAVIATDDLGKDAEGHPYAKPNPYVYQVCLEKLHATPQEAMYIGDNPHKDFVGAKSLGMMTVRIIRPEGDHMKDMETKEKEADRTIQSLRELLSMFKDA